MAVLWIISMWWCHKCHLPLTVSLSLFCVLSSFSLPLTSDSSDLSLLIFFFFSHLFLSHSLLSSSHGSRWSLSLLKIGFGWVGFRSAWVAPDLCGWLQTSVGGFNLAWAVCGRGAWVAVSGHQCSWLADPNARNPCPMVISTSHAQRRSLCPTPITTPNADLHPTLICNERERREIMSLLGLTSLMCFAWWVFLCNFVCLVSL